MQLVFNNIPRIFILLVLLTNVQVFLNGLECIILESIVKGFNNTFILRDAKQLDKLVHSDLTYGHYMGWIENINDFKNISIEFNASSLLFLRLFNSFMTLIFAYL